MPSNTRLARIGAVFLWGLFHLAAANAVYVLAEQSTGMVRARLLHNAFYLLFFAVAGILMAVILNCRNDRQGYLMNSVLMAVADIPFVLFVAVPGLIPWWPGLVGPLLWLIAFTFTTIACFFADQQPALLPDEAAHLFLKIARSTNVKTRTGSNRYLRSPA